MLPRHEINDCIKPLKYVIKISIHYLPVVIYYLKINFNKLFPPIPVTLSLYNQTSSDEAEEN